MHDSVACLPIAANSSEVNDVFAPINRKRLSTGEFMQAQSRFNFHKTTRGVSAWKCRWTGHLDLLN